MRVRATKLGYYQLKRKKEGVEFVLVPIKGHVQENGKLVQKTFSPEDQFSPSWMEKIDESEEKPKSKAKAQYSQISKDEDVI